MNDQSRAKFDSRKRKETFDDDRRRWRADFEAKLKLSATDRQVEGSNSEKPSTNSGKPTDSDMPSTDLTEISNLRFQI